MRSRTTTCPAVPPMIRRPDLAQNETFLTARRGSSLNGSKWPTFRNGGHSSSASSSSSTKIIERIVLNDIKSIQVRYEILSFTNEVCEQSKQTKKRGVVIKGKNFNIEKKSRPWGMQNVRLSVSLLFWKQNLYNFWYDCYLTFIGFHFIIKCWEKMLQRREHWWEFNATVREQ